MSNWIVRPFWVKSNWRRNDVTEHFSVFLCVLNLCYKRYTYRSSSSSSVAIRVFCSILEVFIVIFVFVRFEHSILKLAFLTWWISFRFNFNNLMNKVYELWTKTHKHTQNCRKYSVFTSNSIAHLPEFGTHEWQWFSKLNIHFFFSFTCEIVLMVSFFRCSDLMANPIELIICNAKICWAIQSAGYWFATERVYL